MPKLYRTESSDPKTNAQRNLCDRTHYVDDDTLRFHKSRVLSARCTVDGLLFAIVTSDALDPHGARRGFRYAIFDIFGHVVDRPDLESTFRTSDQATKAMWRLLNAIDAVALTRDAITREEKHFAAEMDTLRAALDKRAAA